jgi:hypothetical protein
VRNGAGIEVWRCSLAAISYRRESLAGNSCSALSSNPSRYFHSAPLDWTAIAAAPARRDPGFLNGAEFLIGDIGTPTREGKSLEPIQSSLKIDF